MYKYPLPHGCVCTYISILYSFNSWLSYIHVLMRDEEEASKVKQTNKAKQHSTPKAVAFPKKNELPRVGLEPTTPYTLDMYIHLERTVSRALNH